MRSNLSMYVFRACTLYLPRPVDEDSNVYLSSNALCPQGRWVPWCCFRKRGGVDEVRNTRWLHCGETAVTFRPKLKLLTAQRKDQKTQKD